MIKKKPKIYLAGPITFDTWRSLLYPERDNCIASLDDYYNKEYVADDYVITGAHAISDDHMCYHFRGHHVASMEDAGFECMNIFATREDVVRACTRQISKSDKVFAFIDKEECYGTLAEIGYAYAAKKPVYILFTDKTLAKKFWFVAKMAREVYYASDYENNDVAVVESFSHAFNVNKPTFTKHEIGLL